MQYGDTQTESRKWKDVIRRKSSPTIAKNFANKKDVENWARTTEDEIIRGIYTPRNDTESTTVADALDRYLEEVTPTKKPSTQQGNKVQAKLLKSKLGHYSLAVLNSAHIAKFRDQRLKAGKSNNTVRLKLARQK